MTTQHTEAAERTVIIIHHLSDLHFQQTPPSQEQQTKKVRKQQRTLPTTHEQPAAQPSQEQQATQTSQREQNALVKYNNYLLKQPRDKRPSIVVITGDLTANGDRNELATVAENLKIAFPEWGGDLKRHIYVVPGPHDVCWTGSFPPSFKEFYEVFGEFALPSQAGGVPKYLEGAQKVRYQVYPINTTYTPDLPLHGIRQEHRGHIKHFGRFRSNYLFHQRFRFLPWQRKRRADELRTLFLELTEGNPLTILDAGTIRQQDLDAFREDWKPGGSSDLDQGETLKILVTHHPLLIHPEFKSQTRRENEVTQRFHDLLEAARKAKFHLAFHGHLHKPQVLSDLSIVEGADTRHSMQQIGAGSLGDNGTFNEIVATYDDQVKLWRFEVRTISVTSAESTSSPSVVLMNPDEDPIRHTAKLDQRLERQKTFEMEIRRVMRQFSESVESERQLDPRNQSLVLLPQVAMSSIDRIIREVIFPADDFDVRVALALKGIHPVQHIVELRNTYIAPSLEGEPRTLLYPASVASWAVILGRTLRYPDMKNDSLQDSDVMWIIQNNKLPAIDQALDSLIHEASNDTEAKKRYEMVKTKLHDFLKTVERAKTTGQTVPPAMQQQTALSASSQGEVPDSLPVGKGTLTIGDLFQPTPTGQPQPYPCFIAVPIPLRSQTGSAVLPEIGVLDISLRERKKDEQHDVLAPNGKEAMFSRERIEMLETLSELCTQILCSADALGRPKGSWSDWLKK